MRLSKKGWNNVLIFSMFTIIFLFNFGHQLPLSSKTEQRSIISDQATIVEIKTPDLRVTRVGRSWKSEPQLGLSELQLSSLVKNWQTLKLETSPAFEITNSQYIMQVYIAEQVQPITVALLQQGENYLLQSDANESLLLNAAQLPLLLGR